MTKDHLLLAFFWIFFCVLHSLLASLTVKEKLLQRLGSAFSYYRIFYTLFAFVTLGWVLYYQLSIPSPLLFQPLTVTLWAGGIMAFIGFIIMIICIKKYFFSLSGLKSLIQEQPAAELMISGIHRYVRHPLYTGTFIFIWGLLVVWPYLSLLIACSIITVYTLIGIELEEQKLEKEFGKAYTSYKETVPKLLPLRRLKRA